MGKVNLRPDLNTVVARMVKPNITAIARATEATAKRNAPPTKQWVSLDDGRVRTSHMLAHGAVLPDNLRFTLKAFLWDVQNPQPGGVMGDLQRGMPYGDGWADVPEEYAGSSSYLLKPRDRTGEHFVQIVNCFPGDTRVSAAEVSGAFRRWYRGDLVRIETEGGRVLTGTPNHEVLTDRGWVALGALDEGSKVVCQEGSGRGPLRVGGEVDPDVDDLPPRIDQVARALTVAGHRQRIAGMPMDFHGDGRVGQVDVVRAEGLLHFGEVTAFREQGRESDLAPAQPAVEVRLAGQGAQHAGFLFVRRAASLLLRGGHKAAAFLRRGSRHANLHSLPPVADRHAHLTETVVDRGAGDSVPRGELLDGDSGGVVGSDFIHGEDLAAGLVDAVSLAGHGAVLDSVSGAERFEWQGFVYNLETAPQWYIANGIVAHNCRCRVELDPQGVARMVHRSPTLVVGTKTKATVYAQGEHVIGAEFGDTYTLPSGPRRENGTYFMRNTVATMKARMMVR